MGRGTTAARKRWLAKNPNYQRDWARANREKTQVYNRRWRESNPEKMRAARKQPMPTHPETEWCECCGRLFDTTPHLDHDHITGEFRGWLCSPCNTGIGLLGDDVEGLRKALAYMESRK